jgi:glycosyltransferase involved in cell wall biosynthesis
MTDSTPNVFLSVVIPVYCAERILPELYGRLRSVLDGFQRPYEIVLVDDRSPDNSWTVARQLAYQQATLVAVRLSRNFGQHYALTAGLDFARGEWTVIMDCDLQDPPEEIPRLLEKAYQGYDIVLARRIGNPDGPLRRLGSALFYRLFNWMSGYQIDPTVGSFRIMRRRVVEAYCDMRETARLFGGMIQWLGFNVTYLDVSRGARYEGGTSYKLRNRFRLALDGIISFSNRPLYASISLGVAMAFASGLYGIFLVARYLLHPYSGVAGWLSTFTALVFIGGLILLNLGVIGVYLGRIYNQTKNRPLYVIDEVVGVDRRNTPPKDSEIKPV